MIICTAICGVAFAIYINKYINPTIDIDLNSIRLNFTSIVYYTDKKSGKDVELEQLYSTENRVWANYGEIPDNLKNAFISIEDARFYKHHGVDWKRDNRGDARLVRPCKEFCRRRLDRYPSSSLKTLQKTTTSRCRERFRKSCAP